MTAARQPASDDAQRVLLLQGGGALGAYQGGGALGAYEALAGGDHAPNRVVGASIGAVNATIIAGDAPERRIDRLRRFWHRVTKPVAPLKALPIADGLEQRIGAAGAVLAGQPGFFRPWRPLEWVMKGPASFYDTSGLEETLKELVDFDLLNRAEVRLSLGAVHVATGNNLYFDNTETKIGPEHVMASGALPPGFPAVSVDGEAIHEVCEGRVGDQAAVPVLG